MYVVNKKEKGEDRAGEVATYAFSIWKVRKNKTNKAVKIKPKQKFLLKLNCN
jgi:hypothetical protein